MTYISRLTSILRRTQPRWCESKTGSVSFESILKQGIKIGPFPMVDGPEGRGPKVDVPLHLISFIAFDEGTAQNVEVGYTLGIFMGFVIQELNSRFERFFV